MSYIDSAMQFGGGFADASAETGPCNDAARLTVEARLAQAEQDEARPDHGWMIPPTLIALGIAGWLMPMMAVAFALAPLAAAGFVLWDWLAPSSATERYHGR